MGNVGMGMPIGDLFAGQRKKMSECGLVGIGRGWLFRVLLREATTGAEQR